MTTLKSLFLKYGINSKTNFDIYDICEDLKLECFICMLNEIWDFVPVATRIPPAMPMRDEVTTSIERSSYECNPGLRPGRYANSYIFNYQTTSEYGSHWCCYAGPLFLEWLVL